MAGNNNKQFTEVPEAPTADVKSTEPAIVESPPRNKRAPRYFMSPEFFGRIRASGYTMIQLADVAGWHPTLFSASLRNVFVGSPETMKRLEAIAVFLNFPVDKMVVPGPPAWDERMPARGWARMDEGL